MFDQVFGSLQKATESSVKLQQEMFQKWVEAFPSATSAFPAPGEAGVEWRKKWEETAAEMLKRQKEMVDKNYDAGIKALADIFDVVEATSAEEYQRKVVELYQKSFDSLRQLSEAQLNEFKAAAEKWSEMMATPST
jgi:hypothetical protein